MICLYCHQQRTKKILNALQKQKSVPSQSHFSIDLHPMDNIPTMTSPSLHPHPPSFEGDLTNMPMPSTIPDPIGINASDSDHDIVEPISRSPMQSAPTPFAKRDEAILDVRPKIIASGDGNINTMATTAGIYNGESDSTSSSSSSSSEYNGTRKHTGNTNGYGDELRPNANSNANHDSTMTILKQIMACNQQASSPRKTMNDTSNVSLPGGHGLRAHSNSTSPVPARFPLPANHFHIRRQSQQMYINNGGINIDGINNGQDQIEERDNHNAIEHGRFPSNEVRIPPAYLDKEEMPHITSNSQQGSLLTIPNIPDSNRNLGSQSNVNVYSRENYLVPSDVRSAQNEILSELSEVTSDDMNTAIIASTADPDEDLKSESSSSSSLSEELELEETKSMELTQTETLGTMVICTHMVGSSLNTMTLVDDDEAPKGKPSIYMGAHRSNRSKLAPIESGREIDEETNNGQDEKIDLYMGNTKTDISSVFSYNSFNSNGTTPIPEEIDGDKGQSSSNTLGVRNEYGLGMGFGMKEVRTDNETTFEMDEDEDEMDFNMSVTKLSASDIE